jgi:hypothetical protein
VTQGGRNEEMGKVVVNTNVTLDGVMQAEPKAGTTT